MNSSKDGRRQVLFQKLDHRWYAFSEGEDGPLFVALPDGVDPRSDRFEFYEVLEQTLEKTELKRPFRKRPAESSAAS